MEKENKYFYEMKSVYLNIVSFILIFIMVIITTLLVHISDKFIILSDFDINLILLALIPYFIFHEILHSIGYVVNGAKYKNITFGMHLEKGILCCSCKQFIDKKTVLWSLMYPFIFIGIITYILGFIFNLPVLIFLSIANISGCAGDIIMFIYFLKIKKFKFFEYDNPMAFGIVTSENLENKKIFGLKMIQEKNITQTIGKKMTISNTSILILIIYYVIALINLFLK